MLINVALLTGWRPEMRDIPLLVADLASLFAAAQLAEAKGRSYLDWYIYAPLLGPIVLLVLLAKRPVEVASRKITPGSGQRV